MLLIDMVDEVRRDDGPRPKIGPKIVPVLGKFYLPEKDVLNEMADGKALSRLRQEYPASKRDQSIGNSWGSEKDRTEATTLLRQSLDWTKKKWRIGIDSSWRRSYRNGYEAAEEAEEAWLKHYQVDVHCKVNLFPSSEKAEREALG